MTNVSASSADLVRAADYDRFLSALFVPEARRLHLFALYAFNHEIAKTAEIVTQPVMGQIRLQWWRETIAGIYGGGVRRYETALALAEAIDAHGLPQALFDTLIDARERDIFREEFANLAELETYADATSSGLMRLAVRVLGGGDALDHAARDAGIAYALTGLLRAIPFHAGQRRLMLPADILRKAGMTDEDVFAGDGSRLSPVISNLADAARKHLARASGVAIPRNLLPALLPASLVRPYLRRLTREGFDIFRDATELSVPRRQLNMLGTMMRGRL